ncbi:MAG: phosphate ABC transporter permease subunit PstC [Desulfarculus sp.]|nr:phosphate ABC transporter permease subunit PstC [Pseudomonadota bacterium]MBV1716260.1 phosphate ABC transporter permease subunit PstC [Desulfarculus sp.]MBU4574503.1 phosphate ABC transporter permease subunit PstC [Pseudomonadota bacterium]MBU4599394.1 phosphate ABC transporter permease subunit PstC [Pseudomonadota bacterium]MBV1737310.1 phosphate ABC transporter permease subunit PstC [Desulfarculus sp.]
MLQIPEAQVIVGDNAPPVAVAPLTKRKVTSTVQEARIRRVFVVSGFFSVIIMGLIVLFLFKEGLGLFSTVSVKDFLFGEFWYPTYDPADFGILPLIAGSMAVTVISSAIAVPLGVGAALYLGEVAGHRTREILKPAVELLASLPSVVLGFVGMVVIAPLMQQWWDIPTGLNILNASMMLAIMAIPTIASISEDALHAVPKDLVEASLALGATRLETLTRVIIPGAISGMGTGVILGMSRAMGETMVVLMVAGGAAQIPTSIFESVRPLPATIAAEMGETPFGSEHYHALFAIGIVLFLLTMGFNLVAAYISRRFHQKGAATL